MRYQARHYAQVLFDLSQDQALDNFPELLDNWFNLLKSEAQLNLLPEIINIINQLFDSQDFVVELVSSRPLGVTFKNYLLKKLSDLAGHKQLKVIESIDPQLLSGCLLKYNDRELDLSLRATLNQLHQQLIS